MAELDRNVLTHQYWSVVEFEEFEETLLSWPFVGYDNDQDDAQISVIRVVAAVLYEVVFLLSSSFTILVFRNCSLLTFDLSFASRQVLNYLAIVHY